jgi:hypothetical protein
MIQEWHENPALLDHRKQQQQVSRAAVLISKARRVRAFFRARGAIGIDIELLRQSVIMCLTSLAT